jgi:eukaryotic-like serine/threonine-protein kinase
VTGPPAVIAERYRLVRLVGSGGMGSVWEAWDERLERRVALKMLHRPSGLSTNEADLASLRAMREARITARLFHRHAVQVFDVVEHEGQPCLIMQFIPSITLSAVLAEGGPLEPDEAAQVGGQIASALAAAHAAGIAHRDVKPGNILIAEDGNALISDFGIARALGDATLTTSGMVHGTPAYLAPEVARGGESNFASDVFSLGSTMYGAMEGVPPFGADQNSIALLHRVAAAEFPPPQRCGRLTPIVMQMLSADADARPSMREVSDRLAELAAQGRAGLLTQTLTLSASDLLDPGTAASPGVSSSKTGASPAARPDSETVSGSGATTGSEPDLDTGSSAATGSEPDSEQVPDPGAATGSERISAIVTGPDSETGSPEVEHSAKPQRSRAMAAAAVAIVVLLGIGILLAALLPDGRRAADPQAGTVESSTAAPAGTKISTAPPSPTPRASTSRRQDPSLTATPRTRARPPSLVPTATTQPTVSGTATAAELRRAITSYYALMPRNTDAAWPRMTQSYQTNHAGGRQGYQRFWDAIDRISIAEVSGTPPNSAQATITYYFKDGRVVRERTAYGLVNEGGRLKINSSTVLSSTAV